ncbi:MAG: hypothetical protein NVS3B7_10120 [Candidatus Elarobacter sp.]
MSYWRNNSSDTMRVTLYYGESGLQPAVVEIKGGEVGFVPDHFDYAISRPDGSGLAPAWSKCEAPAPAAAKVEAKPSAAPSSASKPTSKGDA